MKELSKRDKGMQIGEFRAAKVIYRMLYDISAGENPFKEAYGQVFSDSEQNTKHFYRTLTRQLFNALHSALVFHSDESSKEWVEFILGQYRASPTTEYYHAGKFYPSLLSLADGSMFKDTIKDQSPIVRVDEHEKVEEAITNDELESRSYKIVTSSDKRSNVYHYLKPDSEDCLCGRRLTDNRLEDKTYGRQLCVLCHIALINLRSKTNELGIDKT